MTTFLSVLISVAFLFLVAWMTWQVLNILEKAISFLWRVWKKL